MIAQWKIVFWDVGQGDATTILLPDGSYILIDAGPSMRQMNPLPGWFRRVGNPPIKLAVVTHSHADHFGGLIPLCQEDSQRIEKISVLNDAGLGKQVALLKVLKARKDSGTELCFVDKAQTLYEDGILRLRIVHPTDVSDRSRLSGDVNKTSMIILLERVDCPEAEPLVVFGGDVPLPAIKSTCSNLSPGVLTGPHHGHPQGKKKVGAQEYCRFFRDDLRPSNIFISVSRNNQYKLPNVNYVKGAANAGACVCCSQLSINCDAERSQNVFEGSAFCGVDKPVKSVQCRGAMCVYASADGITFDENQDEFIKMLFDTIPTARCRPNSTLTGMTKETRKL